MTRSTLLAAVLGALAGACAFAAITYGVAGGWRKGTRGRNSSGYCKGSLSPGVDVFPSAPVQAHSLDEIIATAGPVEGHPHRDGG